LIGKVANDGAPRSFGKKGWRFLRPESQPADFMDEERTTCANKGKMVPAAEIVTAATKDDVSWRWKSVQRPRETTKELLETHTNRVEHRKILRGAPTNRIFWFFFSIY
jgi:hypothetical protein